MTILICSTTYGGCGFIGGPMEFEPEMISARATLEGDDAVICPQCGEDNCFGLTEENLVSLTNDTNRDLAQRLLKKDESIVGKANCGCVHHAEEGIPCVHDITLARQQAGL